MKRAPIKDSQKANLQTELSEQQLHQQQMRDIADPYEAPGIGPAWFYLFMVISFAIAAYYLGRHMGALDTRPHLGFMERSAPQESGAVSAAQSSASGASLYTSKCASCHQANGKGLPGAFPPLAQSEYVLGNPERLVSIVLHGLQGPVEVSGQSFNGSMPAWGQQLSDQELVAVINHVRTKLANNQAPAIALQTVQQVRQQTADRNTPWQIEDLKAHYP